MVTADFPLERVNAVAAASAVTWAGVCAATHFATPCLWRGYGNLPRRKRLAWCNRIASALHVRRVHGLALEVLSQTCWIVAAGQSLILG